MPALHQACIDANYKSFRRGEARDQCKKLDDKKKDEFQNFVIDPSKIIAAAQFIEANSAGKIDPHLNSILKDSVRRAIASGADGRHKNTFALKAYGKVGFRDFQFRTLDTLEEDSQKEVPWSLGFSGAIFNKSHQFFVGAGFEYQNDFRQQNSAVRCPVGVEDVTSVLCVSGRFGAPDDRDKALLFVEGRKAFKTDAGGLIPNVAISLRLTYDADNDEFGADMPFYLFGDAKGKLSGGFRVGMRTGGDDSNDGFEAGFFLNSTFDLLKF